MDGIIDTIIGSGRFELVVKVLLVSGGQVVTLHRFGSIEARSEFRELIERFAGKVLRESERVE